MKTTVNRICLGIACLTAIAPQIASAQSTVTLYGRVVSGLFYTDKVNTGGTATSSKTGVAGNEWGTSMFGFKGTEDLGGGLKANFLLESGFSSKNGGVNGGAGLFTRRSYVGLSSDNWGSFRAGKNLNITNDVWYLDPTGQQTVGSATLVKGRSWNGANNMIEYSTPNMGGFAATAQLALGEVAGNSKAKRSEGVSLSYQNDALELRAIYNATHDAAGAFTDVYNTSKETIIGATYKFGPAKLFAAYDYIKAPNAAATAASQLKHAWLGVRYDASSALTLTGAVFKVRSDRVEGKATMLMAGAEYSLSKRTLLYASLGAINNSNGANYATQIYGDFPGVNTSQKTFYTGIAHNF